MPQKPKQCPEQEAQARGVCGMGKGALTSAEGGRCSLSDKVPRWCYFEALL